MEMDDDEDRDLDRNIEVIIHIPKKKDPEISTTLKVFIGFLAIGVIYSILHWYIYFNPKSGGPQDETDSVCMNIDHHHCPNYWNYEYTNYFGVRTYADTQKNSIGFHKPWAIAVFLCTGNMVMSDSTTNEVYVFSRNRKLLFTVGENGGWKYYCPEYPTGVAVNSFQEIIIAQKNRHTVVVLDKTGKFLRQFGYFGTTGQYLNEPMGIAVDQNDNIYVCDSKNFRINIYERNGEYVGSVGDKGISMFAEPMFVAVSKTGMIVVSTNDKKIQIFSQAGDLEKVIKTESAIRGRGLAIDSSENIITTDNGHIVVYRNTGKLVASIDLRDNDAPRGLAITVSSEILVANFVNDNVDVYGPANN